jgi:signal transduction histidine kinase
MKATDRWDPALDRGLQSGLLAFRWVAGGWMVAILLVDREALGRPVLASAIVAAAVAVTVGYTIALWRDPNRTLRTAEVVGEVAVGATLSLADGGVWDADHSQSLGSAWPLAGVLSAGIVGGAVPGMVAGAAIGLARLGAQLIDSSVEWGEDELVSAASTLMLFLLAGGISGYAATRLRTADRRLSLASAREEVAVDLHDGVLQTLAVVQRRSGDPELVTLAREQERRLRDYLFGATDRRGLEAALREEAGTFERVHHVRTSVVLGGDLPALTDERTEALVGAVQEALANAGKHAGASSVTIYAEPADDHGVFCTVKDDGAGFDPASVTEGVGLGRSIRDRVERVGGRVSWHSTPGQGTEVRLEVPA